MRKSMFGWVSRSMQTQDSNQREAMTGVVLSVMACRCGLLRKRSTAVLMLSNAFSSTSFSSRPWAVSSNLRGLRTNSATPSDSSSERI